MKVKIVGGGVFGLSAAAELARRGHAVELFEAGEIPSEKGASRDISKALRLEYGPDTPFYAPAVTRARELWLDLEKRSGRKIYHESGFLCLSSRFEPGGWEYESFRHTKDAGYPVERLAVEEVNRRFPGFDSRWSHRGAPASSRPDRCQLSVQFPPVFFCLHCTFHRSCLSPSVSLFQSHDLAAS